MNLKQLIQERERAFDEKFLTDFDMEIVSWNVESPDPDEIKAFHQETIKLILEKVVEEIKKQKTFDDSYNEALSDLSSQLQEVIKEI